MADHQRAVAAVQAGRRPRGLLRGPTLWLAGATAVTVAATAAVAGPLGPSRLAAAPAPGAAQAATGLSPSAPDFGRRRGNPGAAKAPVAKVALSEADGGKTVVVKPGTEIDVTLKPDSGQRWSQPRSSNPKTVSRGGGHGGGRWGGPGKRQDTPDLGPGRGRQGGGSTQAVFYAHQGGDANLTAAEGGGGLLLLRRSSNPTKSWSVKVTVSGPAPAAPKPAPPKPAPPKPAVPPAVIPGLPTAPSAGTAGAPRLVTPVTPAVQRLLVTLPRL